MARYARDERPHVKPVEKIQLSEDGIVRRAAAAVLCLIVGAAALAYAVSQLFSTEAGWQAIEAGSSDGPTCAQEFTLLYELGAEGRDAGQESRQLVQVYTEACRRAYQLFNAYEGSEDGIGLYDISVRPGQTLTVDPALYAAFEAVQAAGDRTVYLGPVCARYYDVFQCQDDSQLLDFDPWSGRPVAEEYAAIAAYAGDPAHIDVELLGDGQICLRVSEEYLAYAQREGIQRFLDFGWMTNAFVADYLADTLARAGFRRGVLASYDGFIRCLDSREGSFSLDLYGWEESGPIIAGTMEYQGPMSVVSLRAFPVTEGDWGRFYLKRDGALCTPYLDVSDGRCRESVSSLVCWSERQSCVQLALATAPAFIAEAFDPAPLEALAEEGGHALWCQDRVFDGVGTLPELRWLYEDGGVRYSVAPP